MLGRRKNFQIFWGVEVGQNTSFVRCGAPGLVINAVPLQITAVSSTKTHSGRVSSGGSSMTSKPNSLSRRTYDSCCFFASSMSICTLLCVLNDCGNLQTKACVYRNAAMFLTIRRERYWLLRTPIRVHSLYCIWFQKPTQRLMLSVIFVFNRFYLDFKKNLIFRF